MAIANLFGKAALIASQVLKGLDYAALIAVLDSTIVGLAYDDAAARSPEGRTTLELALNLIARFYPSLSILSQGEAADQFRMTLCQQARSINPEIELLSEANGVHAWLVVGNASAPTPQPSIYVGSDGWITKVGSHTPTGFGASNNPFGAAAAACFGAANLFRIVMGAYLPNASLDDAFTLSLLDLTPNVGKLSNPDWMPMDIGETHLAGLGAIGNATVWALARAPELRGSLQLVDPECVELSNLQRYVLTAQTHLNMPKVELARTALSGSELQVYTYPQHWGEYLAGRGDWNLPCVAVALDSAEDRCAVQASLPKWLVNAWTGYGEAGVSRHTFVGDDACAMCLYFPHEPTLNEDQRVAQEIGLLDAVKEVRELLYTNRPISRDLISRISTALGVPIESLQEFEGQPLRILHSKAICGGMVFALGGHSRPTVTTEVPLAFQSALAGIILAAEIVAHAANLRQAPPPVVSRVNLLQPLAAQLSFPIAKEPSGKCICQDKDYIDAYYAKYGRV